MDIRLLLIFIFLIFNGCYYRVNLKKKIPQDNNDYKLFIRKDWQSSTYAIVSDKTELKNLSIQLKLKASFGLGSTYYCDNVKFPDGLVISKNNFYSLGSCLNSIEYLNIDTLNLKFNYYKKTKRLNKKELVIFIKELNNSGTPFFISQNDTSTYFGYHIYTYNVTKTNNKLWSNNDKTGNRIKDELIKKTKYKKHEISYIVTSEKSLCFYFKDNNSLTRIDSNILFTKTHSFKFEKFVENTYLINYFSMK